MPTSGSCFSDAASLQTALASAGDTVAVCDNLLVPVTQTLSVTANNLTLCCQNCSLIGDDVPVLTVSGESFTLSGVTLVDGLSQFSSGANLYIDANGNHRIVGAFFSNGTGASPAGGGNVYVRTDDSLYVSGSVFAEGNGGLGGGLEIKDAARVEIVSSEIRRNGDYSGLFMGNLRSDLRPRGIRDRKSVV